MSKLEALLEDGLRSELMLKQQLKTISEALRQQLQESEKRQTEELERRIHQDALLSTDIHQESIDKKEVNRQPKNVGMRRSISTSGLTSDKETSHHLRQSERPNSSSPAWVLPTNCKHCSVRTSPLTPTKTQLYEQVALFKTTQMSKEEEAEAECQKKFCAVPVPNHVTQPLYQEVIELREKERKQGHEQRKNFLLSIQKPFSFQEREKEKRQKLLATLNQASQDQKNKIPTVRKSLHKVENDSLDSELKDQEEVCRTVHTHTTQRQENSTSSCSPKLRIAEHTRKEKLGFLDEKPSFQPKIIHQIPDFSRLHKALQTEALRRTQSKEVTKCQPFYLRTSALPVRQSRMSPDSQEPKISHLSRSKSLGALTSLSTDTLPLYITDAVRKRCMAIRKSMEVRDSKNQESADWLRKYQMRSQAMKKTVALHAKLMDPNSSLKEVNNEKLKHHIVADRQRTREYMKELRKMKARVSERPYLFEQVKQRNAKAHAEQTYRDKLRKAGFKEQFVQENGETTEGTSVSSRSEDDVNNHSNENNIHSREENVDDGEKIEDVEEESVKSKGEEMP
ncbi:protein FAM161B [Seriola lalandi dorsalis]|uniref:protein FAM161B n=2 Tax=Seriola lalandi dorsalis TaxID=1841481 RepID=UPI000C6F5668|nr:protein FAM161B [Seriola lalandi dorsalis]XP_023273025.1 protein FAM161B [Seriola lalandi dorsalis]